ncbi:MAG: hypothetical protein IK095_07605 [Oscillospiraceae bacterium]|nr:hypothetical protein [Oscillospiraceae bacterium]
MRGHISWRYLTALCFLLLLAVFFVLSLKPFLRETVIALRAGGTPTQAEERIGDFIPGKEALVTLNGGIQRLLGKREVNERYLLDNGHMTYIIRELDMSGIAQDTADLAGALASQELPFLYVQLPFKLDEQDKQLPPGVEDYSNENADRFLQILQEAGVDTLDLRERERAEGLDHYSLFFRTDHHWTPDAGLWAAGEIAAALEERDPSFAADPALFDVAHYERELLRGVFLGSHGRRVGPWYAGVDDICVLTPRFETHLRFSVPSQSIWREGSFAETLLFQEKLAPADLMESDCYDVYCGGQYDWMCIENAAGGSGKRLLVLQDSFDLVVLPFLALGYDAVEAIDLRLWDGDLLDYIDETRPDMVLIIYNPGALEDNNLDMFDFLR